MALHPDLTHGAALYDRHCRRCHEAGGSGDGERDFPELAGQRRGYLLVQLVHFVDRERVAPTMHKVLVQAGLTDPQSLADLSAYLSAQPHDPHVEHGDAHRLGRGRALYRQHCMRCHGALGQGRTHGDVPAIGQQNFSYLVKQLQGFAAGHRSSASPQLIEAMGRLAPNDILAVADFLSRLPQSADPRYGTVD